MNHVQLDLATARMDLIANGVDPNLDSLPKARMIPVIDDPMGKHWQQPRDIRSAPMDDTHVLLRRDQLAGLHEYSSTMPSGVYPGKCWKRQEHNPDRLLLVWYGIAADERRCTIEFREIRIGALKALAECV